MKKDFNVIGFIGEYEKQLSNTEKENFLKSKLKAEKYLPYEDKLLFAENIVQNTSYAMINDGNGLKMTDRIKINSPMRYILFVMTIVDKYTNIEVNFKDIMPEFNSLNQNNMIEIIFSKIGDKEIGEFNTVVEMVLNDFMANEYEIKNFISGVLSKTYDILQKTYPLIGNIINKLENMSEEDSKKLSGLLDKARKFIKSDKIH